MSHLFDDLADVASWFLEVVEFFTEHADFGVEFVASGFEALEVGCSFGDGLFYLVLDLLDEKMMIVRFFCIYAVNI